MQQIDQQRMLPQRFQHGNAFGKNSRQTGQTFCFPPPEEISAQKISFYKQKVPGNKGKVVCGRKIFILQAQKASQQSMFIQKIRQPAENYRFKAQVSVIDVAKNEKQDGAAKQPRFCRNFSEQRAQPGSQHDGKSKKEQYAEDDF